MRRRAREEAEHGRLLKAWKPPEQAYRTAEIDWLDSKDDPRGSASFEGFSTNDRTAAEVVAAGGGVDEVIEATGLRTRENVYRLDAQIMSRALKNDARRAAAGGLDTSELRRLVPDTRLLSRRAGGEPLRSLAIDYDVSQRQDEHRVAMPFNHVAEIQAEIGRIRDEIRASVCPLHGRRPSIRLSPLTWEIPGSRSQPAATVPPRTSRCVCARSTASSCGRARRAAS